MQNKNIHPQEHQDAYDPNDLRDFIDFYIDETRQRKEAGTANAEQGTEAFKEENIPQGIIDLFGAGTDTTSNTVMWLIMYVIAHPEIQDKVGKELMSVMLSRNLNSGILWSPLM